MAIKTDQVPAQTGVNSNDVFYEKKGKMSGYCLSDRWMLYYMYTKIVKAFRAGGYYDDVQESCGREKRARRENIL